ncbi:MAG: phosphoribosylglycinamide formyltransferase [Rhizobiaceae bacterium]|nr:phosphoribosylglycinamide formyltransferase [Rhizobiaceae bacterium]
MSLRKRVAVLISGRGSNMSALVNAAADPDYPAEIACVISDQADAAGLNFASARGIPTLVVARRDFASKEAHDAAIDGHLASFGVDLIALAGYMRLLTPGFVNKWQGRIINIHPSLLPLFKGLNSHQRALDAGMRVHGCSVHFVTADMDEGPVIAQAAVPVLTSDTEAALSARVLKQEHRIYPMALRLVAEGKARMEQGRAVFSDFEEAGDDSAIQSPSPLPDLPDLEQLARITP